MGIKNLFLKIGSAIGVFFSVVFYVFFQMKKDENKKLKEEQQKKKIDELEAEKETLQKINKKQVEEKRKHEEAYNDAIRGCGSDSGFNAGLELLQQLREEGKARNNHYSS